MFFHGKSLQIEHKHYYEFDVNLLTSFSADLQNLWLQSLSRSLRLPSPTCNKFITVL